MQELVVLYTKRAGYIPTPFVCLREICLSWCSSFLHMLYFVGGLPAKNYIHPGDYLSFKPAKYSKT